MPNFDLDIDGYEFAFRKELFGARLRMYLNSEAIDPDRPIDEQLEEWHYRLWIRQHLMSELMGALADTSWE